MFKQLYLQRILCLLDLILQYVRQRTQNFLLWNLHEATYETLHDTSRHMDAPIDLHLDPGCDKKAHLFRHFLPSTPSVMGLVSTLLRSKRTEAGSSR